MKTGLTPDQARHLFAEKTDASADQGRASNAADLMAAIHARHDAALARLRATESRSAAVAEKPEGEHLGIK